MWYVDISFQEFTYKVGRKVPPEPRIGNITVSISKHLDIKSLVPKSSTLQVYISQVLGASTLEVSNYFESPRVLGETDEYEGHVLRHKQ